MTADPRCDPAPAWGPYEVLGPLAAGAMGEVYRARDERLSREVAVKVLAADYATDPDRLRRFEREARAAGTLNHPNLVAVYDTGRHEGLDESGRVVHIQAVCERPADPAASSAAFRR